MEVLNTSTLLSFNTGGSQQERARVPIFYSTPVATQLWSGELCWNCFCMRFICTRIDLGGFDGQGHRSEVKVTRSKTQFPMFSYLCARIWNIGLRAAWHYDLIWCQLTSWHDVMTSQHDNTQRAAWGTATLFFVLSMGDGIRSSLMCVSSLKVEW